MEGYAMSCCYTEVLFRYDLISSCFILSTVSQANLTHYSSCLGSRSSSKSASRNLGKCLTLSRQRPWEFYFKPPIPLANHKYHWYSCFHNLLRPRKTKKIIQLMVMAIEHILALSWEIGRQVLTKHLSVKIQTEKSN